MTELSNPICPLCGTTLAIAARGYPGYQAPHLYDVAVCSTCEHALALPMQVDEGLYDLIYRQRAIIPGYDRYERYAREISGVRDPLAYLALQEENYWGVLQVIEGLPVAAKVLDVGTGLGYLPYAMAARGYEAVGLDISRDAIALARRRFGDHYAVADFFEWSRAKPEHYDLVTMLELIEHVEDPLTWISSAYRLVKPGGKVFISTPNRAYYPSGTVWETEAPPVHLWWFSPESIQRLTRNLGATVAFMDFATCTIRPATKLPTNAPVRTRRSPVLGIDGRPHSLIRRTFAQLRLLGAATNAYGVLARMKHRNTKDDDPLPAVRETLVAVITKPVH